MKYTTIAAALIASLFATPAKAQAGSDEFLAMMLASSSFISVACPGYTTTFDEVAKRRPAVFKAVRADVFQRTGGAYNVLDLVPAISEAVDVAVKAAIVRLKADEKLACREMGNAFVRAGLLKVK